MGKYKTTLICICLCLIASLLFIGCGNSGNGVTDGTRNSDTRTTENETAETETAEPQTIASEPIDYPFPYGSEGLRLVLCTERAEGEKNTYRLQLYDEKDNLLQDFLCDIDADHLVFRFDELYDYGTDLVVFPEGAQTSGRDGLLFAWNYEEKRFREEPIVVPWYEQARGDYTFLIADEQENTETVTLCCINRGSGRTVELRRRTVSRDDETSNKGKLSIWDCLEGKTLYDGDVEWNDDGGLVNDDYYEELFLGELHRPWNISADTTIPTARIGTDGEDDWDFETQDYESREDLLAEWGFQDAEPFYQYFDRLQNLELELYLDESAGRGCGFYYSYGFNYELEKVVLCNGFIFGLMGTQEWNDDTYSLLAWDGRDAGECDNVTQVLYDHTDDGKPVSYEVRGITELTEAKRAEGIESPDDTLLSMEWVYRSDGSLYHKSYVHDPLTFSTFCQSQHIYYDELGRPVYRYEYITHGSYDNYYIYDGEETQPKYGLSLDQNGGYSIPEMVVYQ